jgi:hypothetical protein
MRSGKNLVGSHSRAFVKSIVPLIGVILNTSQPPEGR